MKTFGVDLGGVIDLLSRHIYSGPEVFVRELLQNSRDALIARANHGPIDPAWTIRVIPAGVDDALFHLVDDGIGLSSDEVVDLLSTVGRSSKRDVFDFRNHDYLGHFGIGLLSCFMVADTITITSRKEGRKAVRWQGEAAGTFTVEEVDDDLPVGTRVSLTPARDRAHLLEPAAVARLVRHYGEFLPVPVYIESRGGTRDLASGPVPFLASLESDRDAVLDYGERIIGHRPLDAIPIDLPETSTRGVAYVLAHPTSSSHTTGARVYLGRMLLAEDERELVPPWAFFLRVVVTSDALTPTASRESLVRDETLEATRAGIGDAVREWVAQLADFSPMRLAHFLSVHDLAVRAACVEDDTLLRIVGPHLRFETAGGQRTLADLAAERSVITYSTSLDEFRMLTALGAGPHLVNASYVHHEELLDAVPQLFSGIEVKRANLDEVLGALDEPVLEDRPRTAALAAAATKALAEVDVDAIVKVLADPHTPSLFIADSQILARIDMRRAEEISKGPWASALRSAGERVDQARARIGRTSTRAQVALNWGSPLVQRLAELDDAAVFERSIRLLYVQALLAGRRPLTEADRALMSQSLDDLITLSIGWGK